MNQNKSTVGINSSQLYLLAQPGSALNISYNTNTKLSSLSSTRRERIENENENERSNDSIDYPRVA